ncbi:TMhelix containing protein [Vibrio phage 2.275.O._10N.286.54.E11]|nr:TMhelix containing protein [Vibrio phage 2.275.O._10N.286.54.E11]
MSGLICFVLGIFIGWVCGWALRATPIDDLEK